MPETLVREGEPEADAKKPPLDGAQELTGEQTQHQGSAPITTVEEIMRTDPEAAFEWPAGAAIPGITYTPPSGDA